MAQYQNITFQLKEDFAIISLNKPEVANALDYLTLKEVSDCIALSENLSDVKIIVIQGNKKHFCAGTDFRYIQQLQQHGPDENRFDAKFTSDVFLQIQKCSKLVIALVEGAARGTGWALALACDFIFASESASFAMDEVKKGFLAALGAPFLIQRIGLSKTRELLLSGSVLNGKEAFEQNLIYKLVDSQSFDTDSYKILKEMSANVNLGSIQVMKKLLTDMSQMPLEHALQFASNITANSRTTQEYYQGILNFYQNKENKN